MSDHPFNQLAQIIGTCIAITQLHPPKDTDNSEAISQLRQLASTLSGFNMNREAIETINGFLAGYATTWGQISE